MPQEQEFGRVDFITVGTIGPPGERVFHFQFAAGDRLMTLTLEKEQSSALADSIEMLLDEVEKEFGVEPLPSRADPYDFMLREPILPAFRIAQMGLGYDSEQDLVILILSELLTEDDPEEIHIVRIMIERAQLYPLVQYIREVVAAGRPICGNCGRPIDPDGHFCPKSNGHGRKAEWA